MEGNLEVKRKYLNKGITLIALVVTIVVLLILAGITISLVFSENGIISKAKEAAEKTNKAVIDEQQALNNLLDEMDKYLGEESFDGQIVVTNRSEDSISVKASMLEENFTNYQFSLDNKNWSDKQSSDEYIFNNLEKVIIEDSKNGEEVEVKSGNEYTIYARAENSEGNIVNLRPTTTRTYVEVITDEGGISNVYDYIIIGDEVVITGIGQPCYWEGNLEWNTKEQIEKMVNRTFAIPSYIEGKPVTKICDDAFANIDNGYPLYQMATNANLWVFDENENIVLKYRFDRDELTNFSAHPSFYLAPGNYEAYAVAGNALAKQKMTIENDINMFRIYLYVEMTTNDIIVPPTIKEFISREDLEEMLYANEENNKEIIQTKNNLSEYEENANVKFYIETLESEIGPNSEKSITFLGKKSFEEIKNGDKFKEWSDKYTSEVRFIE